MLRISTQTKQSPQEVLARATAFFGPKGTGLSITPQGPHTIEFSGGGGFVQVEAQPVAEGTDVEILTREWEYDVKRFLEQLA
ncbi:MAG: hypothetical protein IT327_21585 [Anaerolineae bacterium]|jgi:hypothetical protein|nr:hypothetical protein [Anaerolineae bacterium]